VISGFFSTGINAEYNLNVTQNRNIQNTIRQSRLMGEGAVFTGAGDEGGEADGSSMADNRGDFSSVSLISSTLGFLVSSAIIVDRC
jgi:hypothetical protein